MTKSKLLDLIYDRADELMEADKIDELNEMFIFSKATDVDFAIGLLTASLPVKSKLKSRPAYFQEVAKRLTELGETDPTILQGLG